MLGKLKTVVVMCVFVWICVQNINKRHHTAHTPIILLLLFFFNSRCMFS